MNSGSSSEPTDPPRPYAGERLNAQHMDQVHLFALPRGGSC
jgi:hypothetical protein